MVGMIKLLLNVLNMPVIPLIVKAMLSRHAALTGTEDCRVIVTVVDEHSNGCDSESPEMQIFGSRIQSGL